MRDGDSPAWWPNDPLDEDTEHGVDMRYKSYRHSPPRPPLPEGKEWNTNGYVAAMWGVVVVFVLVALLALNAWLSAAGSATFFVPWF